MFRLEPDGTGFAVLHDFDYFTSGGYPYGGLTQGTDGVLYGTTAFGGVRDNGTVFKLNPDGTGFTVLHDFDYSTSGAYPQSVLTQGTDGALYGTASFGGVGDGGTVFKLYPDGSGFTVLYSLNKLTTNEALTCFTQAD